MHTLRHRIQGQNYTMNHDSLSCEQYSYIQTGLDVKIKPRIVQNMFHMYRYMYKSTHYGQAYMNIIYKVTLKLLLSVRRQG